MTDHRPRGLGNPRLIFAAGGEISTREPQREFPLDADVTTIGSAEDATLRLDGLEPRHAEIRHDVNDEYVYVRTGSAAAAGGAVHGSPIGTAVLRTGTRIELGPWTVSFYREEFADQGPGLATGMIGNADGILPQEDPQQNHGEANI